MSLPTIVETGLNDAGTAVAVIVHPERGGAGIFEYVNPPFAATVRRSEAGLTGATVQTLLDLAVQPACRAALVAALESGESIQRDVLLMADGAEIWLGLRLSFPRPGVSGVRYAVLIGRDITQARKSATDEERMRHLLMQVFSRINVAVSIIGPTGQIVMCNAKYLELTGYSMEEIKQLRNLSLTVPEQHEAVRKARDGQLRDGRPYEMDYELLGKGGRRIPTRLRSVLLPDNEQQFRVITMVPQAKAAEGTADATLATIFGGAVDYEHGEIGVISLDAVRDALGLNWERARSRVMLLAEKAVRKRMGAGDLLSRSGESRFILWFEGEDRKRSKASREAMVREIRLACLVEFGDELSDGAEETPVPVAARMVASLPGR